MRKSMRARGADPQQPGIGARNRHRTVLVAAVVVGCAGLVSGVSASTGGGDELQEVDGIGPKTYARLAPHVRV